MLKVITPDLWSRARGGRRRLALEVGEGWRHITLVAAQWDGAERLAKLTGGEGAALPLHTANGLTFGCAACNPAETVELALEGSRAPATLLVRATAHDHAALLCRPVLPASLLPAVRPAPEEAPLDARRLAAELADGDLAAVAERLAMQRLAGRDVSAAASLVLRHMAERPLLRGPGLAALLAALCDHRGTP